MEGKPAIYLGQIVDKAHFRVFIYAADGRRQLVESWGAYEAAMASGLWFATADSVKAVEDKPKRVRKVKEEPVITDSFEPEVVEAVEVPIDYDAVAINTDDFLPKAID